MKKRHTLALAVLLALGSVPAISQTSVQSGDSYVYAPTVLGSRNPLSYVAEPASSVSAGAQADSERLNAISAALNAEPSLKGAKITVAPDGEALLLTGVAVTRAQKDRAMEIATSQAGGAVVVNAIQSEELVIQQAPQVAVAPEATQATEAQPATEAAPATAQPEATPARSTAPST